MYRMPCEKADALKLMTFMFESFDLYPLGRDMIINCLRNATATIVDQ